MLTALLLRPVCQRSRHVRGRPGAGWLRQARRRHIDEVRRQPIPLERLELGKRSAVMLRIPHQGALQDAGGHERNSATGGCALLADENRVVGALVTPRLSPTFPRPAW